MGTLTPGTADNLPAVQGELSWVQLSRQSRYHRQMKNLMETLIPGTASQLQASYLYANYNMTSNGQSNGCKMAPFVNKDLCRGGVILSSLIFKWRTRKKKSSLSKTKLWWIASIIIDAKSWCTFHFIIMTNIRQTAVMSVLKLKIIRHNHQNDEKL